ncbi:coiled-coil domain-containing protein 40 isoform X2 [Antennarius striatus]
MDLDLKEKLALEKSDEKRMEDIHVEMFRIQEQLARLQTRLEEHHHAKSQAEAEHRQAQDRLEETKSQHSGITHRHLKAKASVSQLQAELDNLMLHLVFTQRVSSDLHFDVKAMQNVHHKTGAEKNQVEEQKQKQDFCVEHLTKTVEKLTQQIALCELQVRAQAEETLDANKALSEAEMEMASLLMARKQLQQQWSSSLGEMGKRDEAFGAMQEAVRSVNQQLVLLDREIEGYKKSTTEEQEKHETLTMQMNWSQMECSTSKKLIGQKRSDQDALQAQYSACLRTLRETEHTLARLSKEASAQQTQVNDQRRQLEKESALRLELEDKIMTCMQQALTHRKDVKSSQMPINRMTRLKKEKIFQLWQLRNDIGVVGLECSTVDQRLDRLALTLEAQNEEIAERNKLLTSAQAQISSFFTLIEQKQHTIANYKKKIDQIAASTGHEDLSPLEINVQALKTQIEELEGKIKSNKQLWMKRQGTLVGLTQEMGANGGEMLKLQTEFTCMEQRKMRLEGEMEAERREEKELEKDAKTLRGDLLKLNTLLSQNGQLSLALEQENALMETDFLCRLKEAERQSIEMQMELEKTQDEKGRHLNSLVEAERHVMLWEKKIELLKETRSAVESGEEDTQTMKAEVHRMERRLDQLMKQREQLLRDSEATVSRMENIDLRREAMKARGPRRQTSKGELSLVIRGLQRKIQETHNNVLECEEVIRELQESQASVRRELTQQQQQLTQLRIAGSALDCEVVRLQEVKDGNLAHLVALQNRTKRLQAVCGGGYQPGSSSPLVGSLLLSQSERVHTVSAVLKRVCDEFPQQQGALRGPLLALGVRQALEEGWGLESMTTSTGGRQ